MSDRSFILFAATVAFGLLLMVWSLSHEDAPTVTAEPVAVTVPPTTTTTSTTVPPPPPEPEPVPAPPAPDAPAPPNESPSAQTWIPAPEIQVEEQPEEAASSTHVTVAERWLALADCESGDGTGTPPYSFDDDYQGLHQGALQWASATWRSARQRYHDRTGEWVEEFAWQAPLGVEVEVAKVWLSLTSPQQWPTCGPRVGLSMADAHG